MTLPASFNAGGFLTAQQTHYRNGNKIRGLMIGCEGPTESGKTEFILSCPGPGLILGLDPGLDACLDNPEPPPTRHDNFAFKLIEPPINSEIVKVSEAKKQAYIDCWNNFYKEYKGALENRDARTIGIDGDSDSYEIQRIAELGGLKQIPPLKYDEVNANRRAMYMRAYRSGKIVVATNKVKALWSTKYLPSGLPKLDRNGDEIREWDGKSYKRQGFPDQDYLWAIQLRMFREGNVWGIKILKAKANPKIEGLELKGDECNFESLVTSVYPDVNPAEWGL